MGFGFKQICIITAVGTGVVAGVAIASRNDYSAEKMWGKTKKNAVQMSKKATNAINPKKNKNSDIEKSVNDAITAASLARAINVTLEDSEIIVANGSANEIEETTEFKTITLPAINQVTLYFINLFYNCYIIYIDWRRFHSQ